MHVDLNADLGESFGRWQLGDDEAMLEFVTSANIACGFHAGDPLTLQRACTVAAQRDVRVGAQVAYPDLVGFGRRFIDAAPAELTADIIYQLGALDGLCKAAGTRVRYLKPHGALYHAVYEHHDQASAVVAGVVAFDPTLPVVGLPGSALLQHAERAGLPTVGEFFADRAYTAEGTLVPRVVPGAVLDDPEEVAERVLRFAREGVVTASDGSTVSVSAQSVCLHADSPNSTAMAKNVRKTLQDNDIDVKPFAE
ncbi:MAG: LamB/YcsF family protein [Actinomycetales bacterium]